MDGQFSKIIQEDLSTLEQIISEIEHLNISEFNNEVSFLKHLLKDINYSVKPPYQIDRIFKSIQINSILELEAKVFENKLNLLKHTPSHKAAINYLSKKLISWAKGFGARLWQIICNLLTPQEWSIKGGLGNQSLLGLGNVEVKIKFGDISSGSK